MKRPLQVKYLLLPLGPLFLALVMLLAPRFQKNADAEGLSEEQAKMELALMYVQGGQQPMKGILMLRDLKEKYPQNAEIVWHLGQFAYTTRQYEKAEGYLQEFIEMAHDTDVVRKGAGLIILSDAIAAQGDHTRAIDLLVEARKSVKDTVLVNAIQERLSNYLK
jgi:tetratricopeptide (TPR) repeat protein